MLQPCLRTQYGQVSKRPLALSVMSKFYAFWPQPQLGGLTFTSFRAHVSPFPESYNSSHDDQTYLYSFIHIWCQYTVERYSNVTYQFSPEQLGSGLKYARQLKTLSWQRPIFVEADLSQIPRLSNYGLNHRLYQLWFRLRIFTCKLFQQMQLSQFSE